MELKDFFAAVGGDCTAVLDRLPSEDLVRRFLRKFPADSSYHDLKEALAAGDIPTAFRAAHTMKGTAATLGLDALAAISSDLTETLRGACALPPEELVRGVDAAYALAVEQIGRLDD